MEEGFIKHFEEKVRKDKIDSCLVQHGDSVVFQYFRNRKMKEKQHKIYSVTKSVLSILIGIAIDKGHIPHVNTPIITYFPDMKKEIADNEITIKHLLTMSSGLHWPGNGVMIPNKNWVQFVLDQPVEYMPGQEMVYSCGSSQLLSAILQKSTGIDTVAFAQRHLFAPLGITDFKWNHDSQRIAIGGFGLAMKTEDLLKIGRLCLNKGRWKTKQIVSSYWIDESTTPKMKIDSDSYSYVYHWWILTSDDMKTLTPRTFFALGKNGQYIFVVPSRKLAVVFTSAISDDSSRPVNYFKEYLLPYTSANSE